MAEALYRKYRPQVFEDVVGQNAIEQTLRNAIDQDKVSHAYLFCGPRGTGKTTTARLLAKALLCEHGPTSTPDGTCEDCQLIAAGEHPDVYELDAASRTGVENVREEIIGRVQFAPTRGTRKIYIIDEVHMLSTAAFNALLKTLEEPPSHVIFILCTTDPQKVPETIHSRCQRFDFRRIPHEAIVSRLGAICLAEGVEFAGEALDLIAHRAEGGMRNALTALEQLIAYEGGVVSLQGAESLLGSIDSSDMVRLLNAIGTRDAAACFSWVATYLETGADLAQFARDLAERVRDMYVLTLAGNYAVLEVSDAVRQELVSVLPLFGPDRLSFLMGALGDVIAELKTSTNPRLSFEIALTRMIRPQTDLTLEALAARIETLEARIVEFEAAPRTQQGASGVAQTHVSQAQVQVAQMYEQAAQARAQQAQVAASAPSQVAASAPSHVETSASSQVNSAVQASCEDMSNPSRKAQSDETLSRELASHVAAQSTQENERLPKQATDQSLQAAQRANQQSATSGAVQSAPTRKGAPDLSNPAALQRFWQSVLTAVKKTKAAYGVLLLNTKPVYNAQTASLAITFTAESDFAFKAIQKPEANAVVEQALADAYGAPLAFSYEQVQSGASAQASVARNTATPAQARNTAAPAQARAQASQSAQVNRPAQATQAVTESRPAQAARYQEVPTYDDGDRVPLDAYEGFSSSFASSEQAAQPTRQASKATAQQTQQAVAAMQPTQQPAAAAQQSADAQPIRQLDDAAAQELADLKDALSLFGEGVVIETWE